MIVVNRLPIVVVKLTPCFTLSACGDGFLRSYPLRPLMSRSTKGWSLSADVVLRCHDGAVVSCDLSPDEGILATAGLNKVVTVHNRASNLLPNSAVETVRSDRLRLAVCTSDLSCQI